MLGTRHKSALVCAVVLCLGLLVGPRQSTAESAPSGLTYVATIPIVMRSLPASTIDLAVERIEVVQGVQDIDNNLPLVADRSTLVRVFISSRYDQPLANVRVRLSGVRSELAPGERELTSQPGTVYPSSDRANLATSFNFNLPTSWIRQGELGLSATVDIDNNIVEMDEDNNTSSLELAFHVVPSLKLTIIPIIYTHTPSGITYGAPGDSISQVLNRLYPVSSVQVTMHMPMAFSGDLTTSESWMNLLGKIDALRTLENASPEQVYYGLIPAAWFNGGYAGLGYVGFRDSIGLQLDNSIWGPDAAAYTAAHEIGHNLGLQHAPGCNASGIDPQWPWPDDGHIRELGLDVAQMQIKMPTVYYDIMSYCSPRWVSPFSYQRLMADQQAKGGVMAQSIPTQGLYVWATVSETGEVRIAPVYYTTAAVSAAPASGSDYWVALEDSSGTELVRRSVPLLTASGTDFTLHTLNTLLPLEGQAPARVVIGKGEERLASRELSAVTQGAQTQGTPIKASGGVLRWQSGGKPVAVRYSADGGTTWQTLAVDLEKDELALDAQGAPSQGLYEVILADTSEPVRYLLTP